MRLQIAFIFLYHVVRSFSLGDKFSTAVPITGGVQQRPSRPTFGQMFVTQNLRNFGLPRGTKDSSFGKGKRNKSMSLPHCSHCFGHGVNQSIDPRCEYGCTGNSHIKTGSPRARTGWKTYAITYKNGMQTPIVKGFGNVKKKLKTLGHIPIGFVPTIPWTSALKQQTETVVRTKKTSGKSSKHSLKIGKMLAFTSKDKTFLPKDRFLLSTPSFHEGKSAESFKQSRFEALTNQKGKDEGKLSKTYRKYLTTSTIIIIGSVCGVLFILAITALLKHAKKKRIIHPFKEVTFA